MIYIVMHQAAYHWGYEDYEAVAASKDKKNC
jgi:hypothetical protein